MLDDLCHKSIRSGIVSLTFENDGLDSIEKAVHAVVDLYRKQGYGDISGYYFKNSYVPETFNPREIARSLWKENYYVINRFEKYYVIAFALDFTRFEVYSKDCDKELIKWRENDENDPVIGLIEDPEYNMNPVIRLMRELHSTDSQKN